MGSTLLKVNISLSQGKDDRRTHRKTYCTHTKSLGRLLCTLPEVVVYTASVSSGGHACAPGIVPKNEAAPEVKILALIETYPEGCNFASSMDFFSSLAGPGAAAFPVLADVSWDAARG